MSSSIMTLSDSGDESDDLPPFAERVRLLIKSDSDKVIGNASLKNNKVQDQLLSDNEDSDSRDTIPFSKAANCHPVDNEDSDSRDTIPFSKAASVSPNCSPLKIQDCETNVYKISPLKRNVPQIHFISDSEDSNSRETIPLLRDRSLSPVFSSPEVPTCDKRKDCPSISDDNKFPEVKEKVKSRKNKVSSDEDKEMRKKLRLEKKKEREMIKAIKASEKEILKSQKPEECIKNMKIVLDHNILYLNGSQNALNLLDLNDLKCCFEENNFKYSINWYRKVINIATSDNEILKEEKEELENTIKVINPNEDYLRMLHVYSQRMKGKTIESTSLEEFIMSIKSLYDGCAITCVLIGFEKYLRSIKEEGNHDLKIIAKQVHKNASEEALIELQLQSPVNFHFLENMAEFGSYLCQFTKAIAEAPQRKEKQMQKALAFSWYADIDSSCPVKLAKDSSSFIKLWKQQIQQFNSVGPEVAEAIVSRYPSPRSLLKAYKKCASVKDAENVLQDIVVRRNYGPLNTQKRIGPELSYKLYLFFTSTEGNKLLKR